MGLAVNTVHQDPADLPCRYGVSKIVAAPFHEVVDRLEKAFSHAELTVAFRHDLSEQVSARIGTPYPPYLIWGVTRENDLMRALAAEPQAGLLFPCHVIAFENHLGRTVIMAVDPAHFMDVLRHPASIQAAIELKELLEDLIEGF